MKLRKGVKCWRSFNSGRKDFVQVFEEIRLKEADNYLINLINFNYNQRNNLNGKKKKKDNLRKNSLY